jgi:hypothetical protein
MLYPYSKVVITSSTIKQANKMLEEKIRDEIILKLSPYLSYLYQKEYIVIRNSDDGYELHNYLNESKIIVLPCLDSARGSRVTLLIYEEARLLKKNLVDSVFEKMKQPRQAKYMSKQEYFTNPRWKEKAKSIYITSARFKSEWFWNQFKKCVVGFYMNSIIRYNIFAADIFTGIENGLKLESDYWQAMDESDDLDFRMEDLNEMIGEGQDAFFTLSSFVENQVMEKCFRPPTTTDLYMNTDLGNIPKGKNEVRLVVVDYAFANTTTSQKNDQTNIQCISGHWKKGRFERHWDYIECHEASDSLGAARRVRELYWDYNADYICCDLRNGGEVLFNALAEPWEHPERGTTIWDKHGFTVSNRSELHVVPEAKLNDLRQRSKDPNAIPCIIPVVGTPELNHLIWTELKKQLSVNNCKFLVGTQEYENILVDNKEYFKDSGNSGIDELVKKKLPYIETTSMIYEAINLKAEWKNDKLKLSEPRSGTKDKAIVCAYGNYIISKIELQWAKLENQDDDDSDWDDIDLVY